MVLSAESLTLKLAQDSGTLNNVAMAYTGRFGQSDDYRREELIRIIEHSVENLTLQELEALYYDMSTKNYINEIGL